MKQGKPSRNKFRIVRLLIFHLTSFIALFKSRRENRILVIKLDAIGDYILFRNFLEILKDSEEYKGFRFDLLGNSSWKDIALAYDQKFVSNFFFVNPVSIKDQPLEFLKTGWKLYKNNYKIVLHPTYSRTLVQDGFAAFACASKTIGFKGDNELLQQRYKRRTDKFYTDKLELPESIVFEFYRTKFFFERVLNRSINLTRPHLSECEKREKYIVIFPGSMDKKKEWGLENYLSLCLTLIEYTSYKIVLAGGKSEIAYSSFLTSKLSEERVTSLIGSTTLPELINKIGKSYCVITNDTSAVHIAAATNTPFICIHGVAHYKRFIPYPEGMLTNALFVYEKMPCFNCNWNCILKTAEDESYPCVAINSIDRVWDSFLEIEAELGYR